MLEAKVILWAFLTLQEESSLPWELIFLGRKLELLVLIIIITEKCQQGGQGSCDII